ncbi:MAG: hypothetical protein WC876_02035 [Candidatus Thermoplasmatota archaeon]|jgi:hypothetical protein
MKERPILFSAPMVRAILEGRKTQTRRIVKPQPPPEVGAVFLDECSEGLCCVGYRGPGQTEWVSGGWQPTCPYGEDGRSADGEPATRLWVRETWAEIGPGIIYRASDEDHNPGQLWRPSIFMRRAASRIDLEVTGIRVERLQAISEADAKAEGVDSMPALPARHAFANLWNAINGKRASWDSNPWVWVVEFRGARP